MLAPGGVRLGVAVGWNWTEYDALGQDFGARGARLDEQIPMLRRLWQGDVVSGDVGTDEHLDRMALVPAPPHPPAIWVGGFSEPAYRRGVELGDGFVFAGPTERALSGWDRVGELLEDAGRARGDFGADWCLRGATGGEVAERVAAWEDVGGSHASVVTLGLGLGDVDGHIAHLEDVADALDLKAD
jgi:alkanesulfonate monooxygenase SsuD/methylene tetrahydromethanopterin reductase-like flavin-dependent oxidoreductase (luciferase family)